MRRTHIFSLIILGMLLFTLFSYFPVVNLNSDPNLASNIESSRPPIAFPNIQPEYPQDSQVHLPPSESFPPESQVEAPEVPEQHTTIGSPRITQLTWNLSRSFFNRDSVSDYTVHIMKGMLYHDISTFIRIGTVNTYKDFIMVEDHDPSTGWRWYWPMDEKAWPGEITLMAFNISGFSPIELTEFAIYLYSPNPPGAVTGGLFNYTVFPAVPSGISGLGTMPDLSRPLGPWMQELVPDMPRGAENWVSLPTYPIFLESDMTYANTFYFALNMMPGAAAGWVLMEDVGVPPDGDGEDEGDAWNNYAGLDFISGPSVDFFLAVTFTRFVYPSEIGMAVNGTSVMDLYPNPGIGIWDGGWHSPAINMTNADRYYNVEYALAGLTYDVNWLGWFYEILYIEPEFTVYVYQDWVDWNVSFFAEFPLAAIDQKISISIESDWNVNEVLVNGAKHADWSYQYSPSTGWWLVIDNAARGQWTILCDSPDYVADSEIIDDGGQPITMANSSDTIYVRGFVEDGVGENATNGYGYLLVYDPEDYLVHWQFNLLSMPPGGMIELNWSIWTTATVGGLHFLHILWFNGTEAGSTLQTLEVFVKSNLWISHEYPVEDESVIRGEDVVLEVFYYNEWGIPISDAVVTVINDTSGLEWGLGPGDTVIDYEWVNWAGYGSPGFYTAYINTLNGSIGVLHNITMLLTSPYNEEQTATKTFEIKTKETRIVFFWEGQPLPGLDNVSSYWFTSPEPYINDSSLEFTILYTDGGGIPIKDATLIPYIVHGTLGIYKRLDWIDLSIGDSTKIGFYNITIDTNPIGNIAFHEGDTAYIVIYAVKFGYEYDWSDPVNVQPQPRPSEIQVPDDFQHITLYEDWQYPTSDHPIILRVILRDALNGQDLSHGTVKAGVNGGPNTTLSLATPGLGLYEITNFSTDPYPPGTYNITLYSSARDFVDAITTIILTIAPKQTIEYTVYPNFNPNVPNLGSPWSLDIEFYLIETGTSAAQSINGLKASSLNQPSLVLIPDGTKVTLSITVQGGGSLQIESYLVNGQIHLEGILNEEGQYSFYVSIDAAENYAGLSNAPLEYNGDILRVSAISFNTVFTNQLPLIIIVLLVVILIPLGGFMGYRRYVLIPKRRERLAKYQAIADTFSDVANLNRLLVLHKESGICVFDPFAEESQDATLVAGFLQAISTFGHDLGDSPGLINNTDEARTLRELQYEGFRILINDGKFVRIALVLSGTPSDQLRGRLETFTDVFEKRYKADFKNWEGRVDQFNSASDLVEEVFLISLRHPHSVASSKPQGTSLTSLESDIYKLSTELTKDRQYMFLGQILSTYLVAAKTDKLEALMAIYQLRMKGIFIPISVGPLKLPDISAG